MKRPRRGLAIVSVSENHVSSLILHKVILSIENFRKTVRKVQFCITNNHDNGTQKHEGLVGFNNACSRAKKYVILTSLNYVQFYIQLTIRIHVPI